VTAAAGSTSALRPDLGRTRELASDHELVPVIVSLSAGGLTGPHLLTALGTATGAFLFESATGDGEFARYTFAGVAGPGTLEIADSSQGEDPLKRLHAEVLGRRVASLCDGIHIPFIGGAVGMLAYEAVRAFERIPRAPGDPLGLPDVWFGFCDLVAVLDREEHLLHLIALVDTRDDLEAAHAAAGARIDALSRAIMGTSLGDLPAIPAAAPALADAAANISRSEFIGKVDTALEHIAAGDIFQVQISRRFSMALHVDAVSLYRALRETNPSPYMFFLRTPRGELVGTSPEMLVRVEQGRIDYRPIAGTRRRGRDLAEDGAMELELRDSAKEQAEHLMLVDLGRNDVGRVSEIGSVVVTELAAVRRYAAVMHLESSVTGQLRHDLGAVDALRAAFPAGTVAGAPKVRAMEIIAAAEPEVRGAYAGAVGYLDVRGNLDTAIALRTALVQGDVVHLQAAAGIVADSDPEEEAREIDNKLRALARAVAAVNR